MDKKIYLLKRLNGEVVCKKMRSARSLFKRMQGLMFSEELPDCDGFLIKPCNSIHTFFMKYDLDVIFLDDKMKVVKVIYGLKPWRMTGIYFRSVQVLEMKSGTLNKEIRKNDILEAVCIN